MITPEFSPYRGLVPYFEDDADYFFGRTTEIEIIIANLLASNLTLLYGASGVGKSSVLHAGVAHQLQQRTIENINILGAPGFVVVVFNAWRHHPARELKREVERTLQRTFPDRSWDPKILALPLDEALTAWSTAIDGELLMILDQFEEYFNYPEPPDQPESFANDFPEAANHRFGHVHFLISIREDALARLDFFKGRISALFDNYIRINPLSQQSASEAIEKPLEVYNRQFNPHPPMTVDKDLADAVVEQVSIGQVSWGIAGSGVIKGAATPQRFVEAPFLQLVMHRLWEHERAAGSSTFRLSTLKALGGAQEIVHAHLDAKLNELSFREQDMLANCFDYLVTPSGNKIAHTVSDLAEHAEVGESELEPVLRKLASPGTLILRAVASTADQNAEKRYEVFHDVLARAILDWRARYLSAREFKDHLAVARRRARRNMGISLVLTLFLAVAVALVGFAVDSRQQAVQSEAEAVRRAEEAHSLAWTASANEQYRVGDPLLALALALQANQIDSPDPLAQYTLSDIAYNSGLRKRLVAQDSGGGVNRITLSADGERVLTGDENGVLTLWEIESETVLFRCEGLTDQINSIALHPDGLRAVSASRDGTVRLWDLTTCASTRLNPDPPDGSAAALSPDGAQILWATRSGNLVLWDVETGSEIRRFETAGSAIASIAFSPDGTQVLAGLYDGSVMLWDVATGRQEPFLAGHGGNDSVYDVAFSPDGTRFLSASKDGTLILWDSQTGTDLRRLNAEHGDAINSVSFSPDGRRALSGDDSDLVILWDVDNGQKINEFRGHSNAVRDVAFLPGTGQPRAISGALDGSVIVWDLATGAVGRSFDSGTLTPTGVALSPDGKLVISPSHEKDLTIWNVETGAVEHTLPGHAEHVFTAVFSPDGTRALSGSADDTVILWDMATGKPIHYLRGHKDDVRAVAFSPDGRQALSGSNDKTLILWDLETGSLVRQFIGHDDSINGVAFMPDGRAAYSCSDDGLIIKWDVASGTPLARLDEHNARVVDLALSPDGTHLITGSDDGALFLWNTITDTLLKPFTGRLKGINSVAFGPDGQYVLSSAQDQTVVVWDVETGKPIRLLMQYGQDPLSVAFGPDGKTALSSAVGGQLTLWRIDTLDDLIRWTKSNRAVPDFTCEDRLNYDIPPLCGEAP